MSKGSSLIIIRILRSSERRAKMNNQLMVALCVFDLFGSAAYSLTSLPTPKEEGIFGSQGNEKSCKASEGRLDTPVCITSTTNYLSLLYFVSDAQNVAGTGVLYSVGNNCSIHQCFTFSLLLASNQVWVAWAYAEQIQALFLRLPHCSRASICVCRSPVLHQLNSLVQQWRWDAHSKIHLSIPSWSTLWLHYSFITPCKKPGGGQKFQSL